MHNSNIVNNGTYAFYTTACSDPSTVINAENNWWGTEDSTAIDALVYHQTDDGNAPLVDFIPCASDSFRQDFPTGVFEPSGGIVPSDWTLHQNYPNPFNSHTVIRFTLNQPADVHVDVYNILGQHVNQLRARRYEEAGTYTISFDGTDRHGHALPSGIYLYRLTTDKISEVRKMVLLR